MNLPERDPAMYWRSRQCRWRGETIPGPHRIGKRIREKPILLI
jgi:hypothetical protein